MKKSIRNLILGAAMVIGVFGASTTVLANTQYVQTGMNFRSAPGTTSTVIGSIPAGAQVDVIGSQNGWDQVVYNGTTGYIHGGNVAGSYSAPANNNGSATNYFDNNSSFSQAAQKAVNDARGWMTVSVNGYLALRNAPSYDASNEFGKLYSGDTVLVTGSQSEGSYVWVYSPKYNTYGYVNAGFIF